MATPEGRPSILVRALEDGLATNFADFTKVSMETILERENNVNEVEMAQQSKMAQTLVFVVGGITRDEMAMLSHLKPQRVVCCTTAFLNANTLLSTFHD